MAQRNGQIADWAEADAVLGHIRKSDTRVAKLLAEREAEKAKIDKRYREPLDEEAELRKAAAAALAVFCRKHRRDFGDAKSRHLDNGVVGWELGKHRVDLLTKAKNWAVALVKVVTTLPGFVRTIQEIAKDLMIAAYKAGDLSDEQLAACDLRITQSEHFFIRPTLAEGRDRNADA